MMRLPLQILFLTWVSSIEHYWVILAERRGYFRIFHDSFLMATCSDCEDLNNKFRIATLRYGRFGDLLKGLVVTAKDNEESKRLEDEVNEARRALLKHQQEHRCRP